MRIVHLTPGTGAFICGSCLRDHALVSALGRRGHDVSTVPLYLPIVLEDEAPPSGERVFMGGVNMYLQQKLPLLRLTPAWIARRLDSPRLLRRLASRSDMTGASGLGPMTVSVLRGESGRQARELNELIAWMQSVPAPDVICLSNVMLIGLARRMKQTLGARIVCTLQGEAPFLDALPDPHRSTAWSVIAERVGDVDAFVPVSRHYGELMRERLGLDSGRIHVVHNGIDVEGLAEDVSIPRRKEPVIGYLARMCPDKGLHTLVEAFTILKRAGSIEGLRLEVAGVLLDGDRPYVDDLRRRLEREGLADDARFRPNIDRDGKRAFLASIAVLSVPATYGESFGLYVLEAMAAGVPVVQPRHGAFPEVLEATGGGRLCRPDDPESLAEEIGRLLCDEGEARALAEAGRRRVREHFTCDRMALEFERVCMMVASCRTTAR